MSKVTQAVRGASGVFEAVRDLLGIYPQPNPAAAAEDQTVAFVGVTANELAQPVGSDGNVVQSTTPLGTTTYTSKVFATQGFGRIVGTVYSDANGTLKVEQSPDGTHFDQVDSVAVTGGTGTKLSVEVVAPYAQLVFTPSASQAVFRLYPLLRREGTA